MNSKGVGTWRAAAWLALAGSMLVPGGAGADPAPPIGDAVDELPLFDAHLHYNAAAHASYPPAAVVRLMDDAGVALALLSSTPDAGTITLWEHAPQRFVPELRPYRDGVGPDDWLRSETILDELTERMARYPHRGIGEIHVERVEPRDEALLGAVAALARRHDAIVHLHSGAAPVERLFALAPELTILWAHAGMFEPPAVIGRLLGRYPRLYADTSYRERDILAQDGSLDPAWSELIMAHPDRFMIGSDTWSNTQWARYAELIATNRAWLRQLPRAVAEQVAYRNAERLFGRRVGPSWRAGEAE